jgi:hypothetical protein
LYARSFSKYILSVIQPEPWQATQVILPAMDGTSAATEICPAPAQMGHDDKNPGHFERGTLYLRRGPI